MKPYKFFSLLLALLTTVSLKAQYDDIYYDPNRDSRSKSTTTINSRNNAPQQNNNYDDNASEYDNEYYEGDYYEYDDDYDDYQYSTRIQRFHRPVRGFNYYAPVYSDYYYYDPFYYDRFFSRPGVTIVLGGNNYWNKVPNFTKPDCC